ncbi:MAG TPA: PAS domain S-box protein, partial [Rubrobacter sp.]|nr:PAS domain S-box protein [Rubrobacter sp.]
AEEALRHNEERFRLLVEGVKDYAIFMLDPDGKVASWNEGAHHIKGYRHKEIVGHHFSIFYPEEDLKRSKPERELEIAQEKGTYEEEGWRVRKDGSRFWASVLITALWDEAGGLRGFAEVTRDITEHKRAEEEIQRLNETLEELKDLVGKLVLGQEEEQRRVAYEVHEGLAQVASAAHLRLEAFSL